jgi:hypothetical protein
MDLAVIKFANTQQTRQVYCLAFGVASQKPTSPMRPAPAEVFSALFSGKAHFPARKAQFLAGVPRLVNVSRLRCADNASSLVRTGRNLVRNASAGHKRRAEQSVSVTRLRYHPLLVSEARVGRATGT